METLLKDILTDTEIPVYLHPFTALSEGDIYVQVRERILHLKKIGIRPMNILWCGEKGDENFTPFNSEKYWTRIQWVADIWGERHLDVRGPVPEGTFLVSQLVGSVRSTD